MPLNRLEGYLDEHRYPFYKQSGNCILEPLAVAMGCVLLQGNSVMALDDNSYAEGSFTGAMLRHHLHKSTQYMSQWIEAKNTHRRAGDKENP